MKTPKPSTHTKPNCIVIGTSNLLIDCVNILIKNNFNIILVVSPEQKIKTFCHLNKIKTCDSIHTLEKLKCTFLFSIRNPNILSAQTLAHYQVAINYHNALLPKYAGRHATQWAIFNGEKVHGITWHTMNSTIDGGDIIIQKQCPILPKDTASSLEHKCQRLAITSFSELLLHLKTNKPFTKQLGTKRTHHYANELPLNNLLINFNQKGLQIVRTHNACSNYPLRNTFMQQYILLNGKLLAPKALKFIKKNNPTTPGLYSLKNNLLTISCLDGEIRILECFNTHVNIGKKSGHIQNTSKNLSILCLSYRTFLPFRQIWGEKLLTLRQIEAPFLFNNSAHAKKRKKCIIPSSKAELAVTLGILLIYLYITNDYQNFRVDLLSEHDFLPNFFGMRASYPTRLQIKTTDSLLTAFNKVKSICTTSLESTPWINDVIIRTPELKDFHTQKHIAIHTENSAHPPCALIDIYLSERGISVLWKDLKAEYTGLFQSLNRTLPNIRHQLLTDSDKSITATYLIDPPLAPSVKKKQHDCSIKERFKKIVKTFGKKIALKSSTQTLCYDELDELSTTLSKALSTSTPEQIVGIICQHTFYFPILILGCIKADKIFTLIAHSDPSLQKLSLIEDARISTYLTDQVETIVNFSLRQTPINNIHIFKKKCQQKNHLSLPKAALQIIYTSGSTGKAKGAVIPHSGIIRLVCEANYINISQADTFILSADLSFDAANFETWGALLNGATLFCPNQKSTLDIPYFLQQLLDQKVSILWLTSSLFNRYIKANPVAFQHLNYLIVGGEALDPECINMLIKQSRQHQPKHILNGYGPTENSTFTTTFLINTLWNNSIPIGHAISETTITLLNKYNIPCPPNMPGRICTAGSGLMLGYLSPEGLDTHQLFTHNSQLFYDTHDRGYLDKNGTLHYLSRTDDIIKRSGYRINLHSISTLITKILNSQAIILYARDTNQLTAFSKKGISYVSFFDRIKHHLPLHCIPDKFIHIPNFPITNNGKIDTKKLIRLSKEINDKKQDKNVLISVKSLWRKHTNSKEEKSDLGFYASGGTSITLMDLLNDLEQHLNIKLPLHSFLQNPTLHSIEEHEAKSTLKATPIPTPQLSIEKRHLKNTNIKTPPRYILLTGATGFLGKYLLKDLLQKNNVKIVCLTRKSITSTENILKQFFEKTAPTLVEKFTEQVTFIKGDLHKSTLSLTKKDSEFVKRKIDTILHCAAHAHHLADYTFLSQVNVEATKYLLTLCSEPYPKNFHYISTLSAAWETNELNQIKEAFPCAQANNINIPDGYSQTKWASERLIVKFQNQGYYGCIYRPNWILGDSASGFMHPNLNHLMLLIKGCATLGYAPEENLSFNFTPVDKVSELIVSHLMDPDPKNNVINFSHQQNLHLDNFIKHLNKHATNTIKRINNTAWRKKLQSLNDNESLKSLSALYLGDPLLDRLQHSEKRIENSHYRAALSRYNLAETRESPELYERYLTFLYDSGFLKPLKPTLALTTT